MHKLLLSSRAIYLVTFSLLDVEKGKVDHWVQSIYARVKSAPVYIVGTHAEDKCMTQETIEDIFQTMKRKFTNFENVKGYFAISSKSYRGIPELRESILT